MAPVEVEINSTESLVGNSSRTEKRIAWLTLVFGGAAAGTAFLAGQRMWAVGLAIGAVLGWLNFRLLRHGLDGLVIQSIAQKERKKVQVPVTTYLGIAFRYALIGLGVYVIFTYLHVPLASLIFGLCALAAAAITASVWEVLQFPT
jgi:hypothetical protein